MVISIKVKKNFLRKSFFFQGLEDGYWGLFGLLLGLCMLLLLRDTYVDNYNPGMATGYLLVHIAIPKDGSNF